MHRTLSDAVPYGKRRPGAQDFRPPRDEGCRYGGPSCLRCELPQCVEDLDYVELAAFLRDWQAAQNANGGA